MQHHPDMLKIFGQREHCFVWIASELVSIISSSDPRLPASGSLLCSPEQMSFRLAAQPYIGERYATESVVSSIRLDVVAIRIW